MSVANFFHVTIISYAHKNLKSYFDAKTLIIPGEKLEGDFDLKPDPPLLLGNFNE